MNLRTVQRMINVTFLIFNLNFENSDCGVMKQHFTVEGLPPFVEERFVILEEE